jgi:DNA mismatch repair protein MutL
MPIQVLEPELASRIAAGEVVERPVSVVKELVENCLDAGASQVTIEIRGGGVDQVRVVDDGEGIPAAQVALAFRHHATSKLAHQDQLDCIGTLGFRGEAIPSIAAVSQVTMTSRPRDAAGGQQVLYRWGQKVSEGPLGCSPGTAVTVSDLFGNLPARRKFLKSNSAETARIRELVDRYALAYPGVRFQLVVDGRTSVATPGSGRPEDALLAVYGPEVASGMLRVADSDPVSGYGIDGFVSAPRLNRANRTYLSFFVNRRWIQSRMLSFALEEAYHGLLPERRYPLAALNLTVPYPDVDVNSHPAKREVRFRDESKLYSTLQRAVRAALIADSPVPALGPSGFGGNQPSAVDSGASPRFFWSAFDRAGGGDSARGAGGRVNQESGALTAAGFTPQQALPALRVVGQVRLTYIVAEGPDGMYLVDQHAAHERVLFDRIVRQTADRSPESQPLLSPITVDLTPGQSEVFRENLAFLANYGFEVEPFGLNSHLLRSVPSVMTSQDPAQSLVDILDMVAFEGLVRQHEDVLAASIACHSAIRAGKSLTEPEMRALLEELEVTDNPHTCPHGRPTLIHISEYQMDREFGRR